MQAMTLPATTSSVAAAPVAVPLNTDTQAPVARPAAPPPGPFYPVYGPAVYGYGQYAWPGYPYGYMPRLGYPVPPASAAPAPPEKAPPEPKVKVEEKPVEKIKTPEEKAEEDLFEVLRHLIRENPKVKALITPELVEQLKTVSEDPAKLKDLLIQAAAQGQVGDKVKSFMGKGLFSKLFPKIAMWISPPQTDPLVSNFFKQLASV